MNPGAARDLARRGELYPAVIVHGGTQEIRIPFAVDLARTLLCEAEPAARPCGHCRHCRRIVWPEGGETFHPDFQVLLRDLKTSTSVEAARNLLRVAQVSPFEARGQVFVVANAETLSGEAANSLLKTLEEPHDTAPRHFLLLAPSQLDLLRTLRSRSLALYLGPAETLDASAVAAAARAFADCVQRFAASGAAVYLLAAADTLKEGAEGWEDPRASRPWASAAAMVTRAVGDATVPPELNRRLLALAAALLEAGPMRLRAVAPERILEGLLARHLAGSEIDAV
jgi:DNA polymerase III delta subunit-like protein